MLSQTKTEPRKPQMCNDISETAKEHRSTRQEVQPPGLHPSERLADSRLVALALLGRKRAHGRALTWGGTDDREAQRLGPGTLMKLSRPGGCLRRSVPEVQARAPTESNGKYPPVRSPLRLNNPYEQQHRQHSVKKPEDRECKVSGSPAQGQRDSPMDGQSH